MQIGSTLGLAISQSAAVSAITVATTGDNIHMSSAMAFGGSSVPNNSLPICTGSASTTGSVQPQFLHSIIQHSSFPISFSPGQAAPSTGGHVSTQQVCKQLVVQMVLTICQIVERTMNRLMELENIHRITVLFVLIIKYLLCLAGSTIFQPPFL